LITGAICASSSGSAQAGIGESQGTPSIGLPCKPCTEKPNAASLPGPHLAPAHCSRVTRIASWHAPTIRHRADAQ
jgi:hypothetical protein